MIMDFFECLCRNIEISSEMVMEISRHKNKILMAVDDYYHCELTKSHSQFIGSYGRNTAVFLDNIRIMTVIPGELYWKLSLDVHDILKEMKTAINKKYLSCDYSDNGDGLNININGSLSFDIVPGFVFDDGIYIYLCNNTWKKLNFEQERYNFNLINKKTNNNLVRLCRILKLWKNTQNIDIGNILLDTYAYHFLEYSEKDYNLNTFDEMLTDFFEYLLENSRKNTFVSFDRETILKQKIDIRDVAFFSASKAQFALASANCGRSEDAINDWKRLLGCSSFINLK